MVDTSQNNPDTAGRHLPYGILRIHHRGGPMLMTMEDESNNKTQLKLPRIFTLAGFALIALAIFSFFMSVLCGLGGSGSCDGDSSTYLLYGIFGVLAIAIAQVLNKDRSISLANMWLLLWILVLLAIFIID